LEETVYGDLSTGFQTKGHVSGADGEDVEGVVDVSPSVDEVRLAPAVGESDGKAPGEAAGRNGGHLEGVHTSGGDDELHDPGVQTGTRCTGVNVGDGNLPRNEDVSCQNSGVLFIGSSDGETNDGLGFTHTFAVITVFSGVAVVSYPTRNTTISLHSFVSYSIVARGSIGAVRSLDSLDAWSLMSPEALGASYTFCAGGTAKSSWATLALVAWDSGLAVIAIGAGGTLGSIISWGSSKSGGSLGSFRSGITGVSTLANDSV